MAFSVSHDLERGRRRKPLQCILYATPMFLDLVVFAVCYSHTFELRLQNFSSSKVISFFSGEASEGLSEVFFSGSDDKLCRHE